jgi:RarD protein
MDKRAVAKAKLLSSMLIWGSLGLFVRGIPLPSSVIANSRGIIGSIFLIAVMLVKHIRLDLSALKRNWLLLLVSGIMLGLNWIMLFESYRYTTIAVSTLCYYLAPIIVVAVSPIVFGEKLNGRKILCVLAALVGMVFVSGVIEGGLPQSGEAMGIVMALGAACLYAAIVICNKKLQGISGTERTVVQLLIAAIVLLPYNLLTVQVDFGALSTSAWALLLVVGIVHTGICYYMYFGCIEDLPSQTVAILAYVDPVVAVLLSALLLKEPMSGLMWLGALLIIGAAVLLELPGKKSKILKSAKL